MGTPSGIGLEKMAILPVIGNGWHWIILPNASRQTTEQLESMRGQGCDDCSLRLLSR